MSDSKEKLPVVKLNEKKLNSMKMFLSRIADKYNLFVWRDSSKEQLLQTLSSSPHTVDVENKNDDKEDKQTNLKQNKWTALSWIVASNKNQNIEWIDWTTISKKYLNILLILSSKYNPKLFIQLKQKYWIKDSDVMIENGIKYILQNKNIINFFKKVNFDQKTIEELDMILKTMNFGENMIDKIQINIKNNVWINWELLFEKIKVKEFWKIKHPPEEELNFVNEMLKIIGNKYNKEVFNKNIDEYDYSIDKFIWENKTKCLWRAIMVNKILKEAWIKSQLIVIPWHTNVVATLSNGKQYRVETDYAEHGAIEWRLVSTKWWLFEFQSDIISVGEDNKYIICETWNIENIWLSMFLNNYASSISSKYDTDTSINIEQLNDIFSFVINNFWKEYHTYYNRWINLRKCWEKTKNAEYFKQAIDKYNEALTILNDYDNKDINNMKSMNRNNKAQAYNLIGNSKDSRLNSYEDIVKSMVCLAKAISYGDKTAKKDFDNSLPIFIDRYKEDLSWTLKETNTFKDENQALYIHKKQTK